MNTRTTIFLFLLIALITFAGGVWVGNTNKGNTQEPKPEYWENPNFETQIKNLNKRFDELKVDTFKEKVKSATILNYITQIIPPTLVGKLNDSLVRVIDSLTHKQSLYDIRFLTQYPNQSKLLEGLFTKDSLTLSLLNPEGKIQTKNFGVNYQSFNYQYLNGELRANKLPASSVLSNNNNQQRNHNFYVSLGYESLLSSGITSLDYQFLHKRIKIETSANILIYPKKDVFLIGKIGYRLNN
jgi:hypothetical protein